MKCDIVIAGVGGQGVLSTAAVIAAAAVSSGLNVKQTEVHGMAQRGGSVVAHLRIANGAIAADTVPRGTADILLGAESLEGLRMVSYLAEDGWAIVSGNRVENMAAYPEPEAVHAGLSRIRNLLLLDSESLARDAGSVRAANTVLLGAAADLLPMEAETLRSTVLDRFSAKGEKVAKANDLAFTAGREAMQQHRE